MRVTRLTSSRSWPRGSAASTTSPGRAGRRATRRRSPGRSAGAIERPRTSTTSSHRLAPINAATARRGQSRSLGRIGPEGSGGPAVDARLLRAAGRLPHLVDGVDHGQQLLGCARIDRLLDLGGLLGGLPEGLVQVRVLLEMLGLEVVVPEDVEVVLHELGALLLDVDAAGAEVLVVAGVVLLDDAQAGLGLDPGLLGVIYAARDVAVGVDDACGAQDGAQGKHRSPFDEESLACRAFILGRCKPRADPDAVLRGRSPR